MSQKNRCGWVKLDDPLYVAYHDEEWGRVLRDERALFELFSLETQAAGLSWLCVLKKREAYREAFEGFYLEKVATFTAADIERIMQNYFVIKNRPKIEAIVSNAKCFIKIVSEFGSFYNYFFAYVQGAQIVNDVVNYKTAPCTTDISDAITKDLKKRGFKFIGSLTVYAFMQACGMVDDHENSCFCKKVLKT